MMDSTNIPTDRSNAVPNEAYRLCLYIGDFLCDVCFVIICSSYLLSLVPQEGCSSRLWHFLGIFTPFVFIWLHTRGVRVLLLPSLKYIFSFHYNSAFLCQVNIDELLRPKLASIKKTRLFKYIENFTTKK